MDIVALACLPVLAIAAASVPAMFSMFRGPRGVRLLIPLSVILVAGPVPLVLGIVSARRARRRLMGIGLLAWIGVVGSALNLLAAPLVVHVVTERAGWDYGVSHGVTRCASNLRMLGQACLIYSNEHQGNYPSSLMQLLAVADMPAESLACQLSDDTPARSTAELPAGGHVSYLYLGAGFTQTTATGDVVIAYERPTNHDGVGLSLHVLYGDGRVERVSKAELERLIRELESGHNPPRNR